MFLNINEKFMKTGGININNYNTDENYDKEEPEKKSRLWQWFKRIVYSVCILIIVISVYRLISTAAPKELKNYIIKNEKIERIYTDLKEDFRIYKIDARTPFALGDAMFLDNIYYLESAENLQMTLRCKNSRIEQINSDSPGVVGRYNSEETPLIYYLKVSGAENDADIADIDEIDDTGEYEKTAGPDYILLKPASQKTVGKNTDRYRYFVLSFDGVKIDYANTKVELYILRNGGDGENMFDGDDYFARFTVFDVITPKSKIQAKKLMPD